LLPTRLRRRRRCRGVRRRRAPSTTPRRWVDAAAELAERGVGVDGDHAVVLPKLAKIDPTLAATVVLPTPPLPKTPIL
jgi:hypothetical protein